MAYEWQNQYDSVNNKTPIDVRDLINDEWAFMIKDDFNPVPLALALMDGSSLGKDYELFTLMLRNIESALKEVVDESYQGFNASIGTYGGVIDSISDSQSRVKELRMDLKNSKESLHLRHADLVQLYNKSQQYKDMIEILDEIDELKKIPTKLETLVREKHFLAAVTMLVTASQAISKPEMATIGALSDLSRYFSEQLELMGEVLVEELHNHLYLKSPYCDSRWVQFTSEQESLQAPDQGVYEGLAKDPTKLGNFAGGRFKRTAGKAKPGNEVRLEDEIIVEDLELNPETDSLYYLEILVESLGVLGKFKDAIATIVQRVPLEAFQLIDKTIGEVNERRNAEALKSINPRDATFEDEDDERHIATRNNENEILRDLFWTLFSKLDCVIRGHSTVLTTGQRLLRRVKGDSLKQKELGLTEVEMYTFADVWTPILTEVRCLLSDYLMDANQSDADSNSFFGNNSDLGSEILKSRRANRDTKKQLFKSTDSAGSASLYKLYDQIRSTVQPQLRETVPMIYAQMTEQGPSQAFSGLIQDKYTQVLHGTPANNPIPADGTTRPVPVSASRSSPTASSVPLLSGLQIRANLNQSMLNNSRNANNNPDLLNGTSASGHRSLVKADPAHISVVIRPTVAFVERVREAVPQSRDDGTVVVGAFFDHGVINVPMGRF